MMACQTHMIVNNTPPAGTRYKNSSLTVLQFCWNCTVSSVGTDSLRLPTSPSSTVFSLFLFLYKIVTNPHDRQASIYFCEKAGFWGSGALLSCSAPRLVCATSSKVIKVMECSLN